MRKNRQCIYPCRGKWLCQACEELKTERENRDALRKMAEEESQRRDREESRNESLEAFLRLCEESANEG